MKANTSSKRVAGAALALVAGTGLATALAIPAEARMNVHCAGGSSSRLGQGDAYSVGIRQVDPIVARGSQVSMHEHMFFGNINLLNMDRPDLADYSDMVGPDKRTSCNISKDTAAYWAPVLRYKSTGQPVRLLRFEMYYQSWNNRVNDPKRQTNPFPADLRMVAGNPMAQNESDANPNVVAFSCGHFSSKAARLGFRKVNPVLADCSTARNLKPGSTFQQSVNLTGIVQFPTCWSGRLNDHRKEGNTADYVGDPDFKDNQMAYTNASGQCPAGFPVKLPKARFTVQWDYRGDGTDVEFSSGMGEGKGKGDSFHADFWNTWDQASLTESVNTCINTSKTEDVLHAGATPKNPGLCGIPVP